MPKIAGDEVVGAGLEGALQELIVIRIGCHAKHFRGDYNFCIRLDQAKGFLNTFGLQSKPGPFEDLGVFPENIRGGVESELARQGEVEDKPFEAAGIEVS